MRIVLPLIMVWMLLVSALTMDAAAAACRLFITGVLPGLFPYMVLSLMLVSRMSARNGRGSPGWLLMLLGWGGGSPTGARLMYMMENGSRRKRIRLAVSCATMSPMFLAGTTGAWLGSAAAGWTVLGSVILGGWLTGVLAGICTGNGDKEAEPGQTAPSGPLSFGAAVDLASRTMLLVCGTMVMLRVFAAMAGRMLAGFPAAVLPVTTLLEVTTGVEQIAAMPLPLPLRTALIAGATGFGGLAILMQNRTMYDEGFMRLGEQLGWQAVHGVLSFLLALGLMQL